MNWVHILLLALMSTAVVSALLQRSANRKADNPFEALERFRRMREDFERKG